MQSISQQIEQYTAQVSNFQTKRNYISLSHAHDNLDIRLKCYKGYQWEKDLMARLSATFPDRVYYDPEQDFEISAFDRLVRGHVEALFDGYPCDGKTVPLDEHLPKDGKVSRRIYWQMQAYMKFMHKEKALLIFESRETGHLRDFWIRENASVQQAIHDKYQWVVNKILSHAKPKKKKHRPRKSKTQLQIF